MAVTRWFVVLLLACPFLQSQVASEKRYVLLSKVDSKQAAGLVSLWPSEKVTGVWEPSEQDIELLESNISHVADIKFLNPDYKGSQIPHPEEYLRQYFGVFINGRKLIYVNALCEKYGVKYAQYWRERFVDVYDGGSCFWHVRYDPATKKFSELMVNGVA